MKAEEVKYQSYYTGTMSPEEKAIFEKELANDIALQKEYRTFVFTYEAEETLVARDLRAKMKKWQEMPPVLAEEEVETPVISMHKKSRISIWKIAAVFIGAVGVIGLMWNKLSDNTLQTNPVVVNGDIDSSHHVAQTDTLSTKNIESPIVQSPKLTDKEVFQPVPEPEILAYAEISNDLYEEPTQLYSNLKSDVNNDLKNKYNQALQLFKDKDYKKALKQLGSASKNEESTQAYLRGHIYYNLKDFKSASKEFEAITKDELLPNFQDARWYYLLSVAAQLPRNKKQFDTLTLELLNDENFEYKKQLEKLLADIKVIRK